MSMLKLPVTLSNKVEVQNQWLRILKEAQDTVQEDADHLQSARKGMRLKERAIPPEMVGRSYAKYCDLINKVYDAYLNNVHLQRAPYMQEIVNVIVKRMYELHNELVHIIVNDYFYVDTALTQLQMTPLDIQIVIPYHFPLESRGEDIEQILQQMWKDAVKRKKKKERLLKNPKPKTQPMRQPSRQVETLENVEEESEEESESPPPSVHTIISETFINCVVIQRHERFRQWYIRDVRAQAVKHKLYFAQKNPPPPLELKNKASNIVQVALREFMKIKRERTKDATRDILLGIMPDAFRKGPSLVEENNKIYERRRRTRMKIEQTFLKESEKEKARLILFRQGDQMDDITDEIRVWFKEWFYDYHFFPEFPHELLGGTLLLVRGDLKTIEEKKAEDEKMAKQKKLTKEQIKAEKERAAEDAKMKEAAMKEAKKKEAMNLMKNRCNPASDPGYMLKESAVLSDLIEALRNYRTAWSYHDELPVEKFGEAVYGYLKPFLTEDLMMKMHIESRKIVDEMLRLDLKLLIKKHQIDFKNLGVKYPKIKPTRKPKLPPEPVPLVLDETLMKNFERVFDLNIVTKPTTKLCDILGDSKYAVYPYNIKDPDATFPLPGYGDIKNRLMLSCVFGTGIQPGAPRLKAVMLLGPSKNGKSFLADAVAGEMNAVKINISPEVFSAMLKRPGKQLNQVFVIARAFQPAVVFLKDIEKVFATKVPPEDKHLNARSMKGNLVKLVKQIPPGDKVIFIATCSNPWSAKVRPMMNMFDEVILVPRTDYGTVRQFFSKKLLSIRSIPRDYSVQPIAKLLQGYSFGDIIDIYNQVMTPARIVRLNIEPLSPGEFLDPFIQNTDIQYLTVEDYQKYVDMWLLYSPLKKEREEYATINWFRAEFYKKEEKKRLAALETAAKSKT